MKTKLLHQLGDALRSRHYGRRQEPGGRFVEEIIRRVVQKPYNHCYAGDTRCCTRVVSAACPVTEETRLTMDLGPVKLDSVDILIDVLAAENMELDQRMLFAFQSADKGSSGDYTDAGVFAAILQSNPSILSHLDLRADFVRKARQWAREEVFAQKDLDLVLERAASLRPSQRTLGTRDFLLALLEIGIQTGDSYQNRPFTVDLLTDLLDGQRTGGLSRSPKARFLLEKLRSSVHGSEDFQYVVSLQGETLFFRVVSLLHDYVQETDSGLLLPQRAILTHFKDKFGGFTQDEIAELQDLLNSPTASEADFQRFFEDHTHFFRKWDYREVYPQVVLARPEGNLVPDFILTDRRLQRAAILDLKLSRPKLVRRQRNRDRFTAAVMEARTQLLRYRDWFRRSENRLGLKKRVDMAIYEPHLIAVIGRSSEFRDQFDRQQLTSDYPDVEVVTYDDLVTFAERRRLIIENRRMP